MKTNFIFAYLSALILTISATGCANHSDFESSAIAPSENLADGSTPQNHPLLWDSVRIDGRRWTQHVFQLIQQQTPNLILGAEDVTAFCPQYFHLSTLERVNFWGLLVSAMVKYESDFKPTSRMQETTMGLDPVTRRPVYSEGLLQLSYQDAQVYPFCDEFSWGQDKNLPPTDPRKTILDPYKNLNCGVRILAQQIKNKNRITLSRGAYWSVLKIGSKYNKIQQIAGLTKKMPGCMN